MKNNPFLAAESSGWGFGWGGGGGTEEFVKSFAPAHNETYEGPEFQEDAQIKVEYVANEHDIYDMKQIKGQEISDGNCGVFISPPQKTKKNNSLISALTYKRYFIILISR